MDKKIIIVLVILAFIILLFLYFTSSKNTPTTSANLTTSANPTSANTTSANLTTSANTTSANTTSANLTTSANTTSANTTTSSLLDETLKAFNIKVDTNTTMENFETTQSVVPIVFNIIDDVKNNIMEFFKYFYPKMNINEINTLLNEYNITKTMEEILNENKNNIYIEDLPTTIMYEDLVYDETDDNKIADNIRAYRLILNSIGNININSNIREFINNELIKSNRTLPSNKSDIQYINLVVSNDFSKNDTISLYFKTNYTEDLHIKGNEPSWDGMNNSIECLTSQLCKISTDINIQSGYIIPYKTWAINNMDKIKRQFNFSMIRFLLTLNGSDISKINNDFEPLRIELYNSKLEWINSQPPNINPLTAQVNSLTPTPDITSPTAQV